MNIEQLISSGSGGVFQIPSGNAGINAVRLPATMQQQVIDTTQIEDKASLLSTVSAAMRFPDHFGHNWDALYDCISEQAEQTAQGLLLIFTDLSQFAQKQPEAFRIAVEVMNDAVTYWEGTGKQLVVLIGLNGHGLVARLPTVSFD